MGVDRKDKCGDETRIDRSSLICCFSNVSRRCRLLFRAVGFVCAVSKSYTFGLFHVRSTDSAL